MTSTVTGEAAATANRVVQEALTNAIRHAGATTAAVSLRAGLRTILDNEPGLTATGEAADGESAVGVVSDAHPDVVLLDVRMPGWSRLTPRPARTDLTRRIRRLAAARPRTVQCRDRPPARRR